jgi:putative NADH-flavin reductase
MKKYIAIIMLVLLAGAVSFGQQMAPPVEPKSSRVSYGIVVDNSGSFRLLLERVIRIVKKVVDSNGPDDETFIVTFVDSDKIRLRQDLTSIKADLYDAAENMFIEGGKTAIIDAVKQSADHLAASRREEPGRIYRLVLITDGDESESKTKIAELFTTLRTEKIQVLVIGISDLQVDAKFIDRLVKESGGRKYLPKTQAEIDDALKLLIQDLRAELK